MNEPLTSYERVEQRRTKRLHALLLFLAGLLLTGALFLGIRCLINSVFLKQYENGKYEKLNEKILFNFNFPEGYLPYYNMGNAAYLNGDYNKAIEYYNSSLKRTPPHETEDDKECDIRVNLALAMLQKIDWTDLDNEKGIERAVNQLWAARNILTENGCANPDDPYGHNAEAEQLKKEIDELLKQLSSDNGGGNNNPDNNGDSDNNDSGNESGGSDEDKREKEIREKLEDEREQGQREKYNADQNRGEWYGGNGEESYDGEKW